MDNTPPNYRLSEGFQLVPMEDHLPPAGWSDSLCSEQIDEGWHLNRFDYRADCEEVVFVQGPPTFSISVFLNGSGHLSLDNGPALEIVPGSVFLFHAQHPTRGLNQVNAGSHMFGIDFRFAPSLLDSFGLQSLGCLMRAFSDHGSVHDALLMRRQASAPLRRIADDVMSCRMVGTARRVYMQAKALELLSRIIAFCEEDPPLPATLRQADLIRVQEAVEILTHRYSEPWTIAELAREAGINERKLKLGFRTFLGRTVHDHLERTRITAAQSLMVDDDLNVTEAALAVGYSTPSHFAKVFKRRTGISPSAWRRHH